MHSSSGRVLCFALLVGLACHARSAAKVAPLVARCSNPVAGTAWRVYHQQSVRDTAGQELWEVPPIEGLRGLEVVLGEFDIHFVTTEGPHDGRENMGTLWLERLADQPADLNGQILALGGRLVLSHPATAGAQGGRIDSLPAKGWFDGMRGSLALRVDSVETSREPILTLYYLAVDDGIIRGRWVSGSGVYTDDAGFFCLAATAANSWRGDNTRRTSPK